VTNKCGDSSSITYSWDFTATTNPNFPLTTKVLDTNKSIAVIGSKSLNPGYTYTFRATAKNTARSEGFSDIKIYVNYPDLELKLNKADGIVSSSANIQVSAKANDPAGTEITYQWSCFIEGSACTSTDGTIITLDSSSNLNFKKENIVVGSTYSFKVSISTEDGRTKSSSVTFTTIDAPASTITLTPPAKPSSQDSLVINPEIDCPDGVTFKWEQISGSTVENQADPSIPALQLSANSLKEGNTYNFLLSILNPSLINQASLTFSTNEGPKGGTFTVSPTSGTEFTTKFTYLADSYYDGDEEDYPLTYSFGYKSATGTQFRLKIESLSNTYTSSLNKRATQVGVVVCMLSIVAYTTMQM